MSGYNVMTIIPHITKKFNSDYWPSDEVPKPDACCSVQVRTFIAWWLKL